MYTVKRKLLSEDVGVTQSLKLSRLLSLCQELSIAHTTELGMGREKTLDQGLLWVVGRQKYIIHQLPKYDEEIEMNSWSGLTMHALFPRYYEFQHDNTTYIEGVAIWSLIKKKTRKIIFAEDYGLSLPREKTGRELPFPLQISCPKFKKTATLLANWSNCDLNGHLNNAYYLDFVEGLIPISFLKKNEPKLLEIEYIKEIKLGEAVLVTYGKKDKDYYFTSPSFTIHIKY